MKKSYSVKTYFALISNCENKAFHSYFKERHHKLSSSRANPRQYRYFTYIEKYLKNYDANDRIMVQSNGNYGIRRDATEVSYGHIDLNLINNPCYPKYTRIF